MPSWEGFKTWLDYEIYLTNVLLVVVVIVWIGRVLLGSIDLNSISTIEALSAWGALIGVSLGLVWWIGRTSHSDYCRSVPGRPHD
jgi:hypothetical protein